MVERKLETERKLNLKEAKEELWRHWRQKKGRTEYKKKTKKEEYDINLERKLERIELEIKNYEEELEKELVDTLEKVENKNKQLEKKRKKEQHWEMLAWIVAFIEENKSSWETGRKEREQERKEKE